jgi:hypothetical protein
MNKEVLYRRVVIFVAWMGGSFAVPASGAHVIAVRR